MKASDKSVQAKKKSSIDFGVIAKYRNISCKTSNAVDHVVNDDSLQRVLNNGERMKSVESQQREEDDKVLEKDEKSFDVEKKNDEILEPDKKLEDGDKDPDDKQDEMNCDEELDGV